MLEQIKRWAKRLKHNIYALYLAYHSKDVPLLAKIIAAVVVAYALSPIDLIPDFIPVIGYLDDMILLPLAIALAIRLIPTPVWEACKHEAHSASLKTLPRSKTAAAVVLIIWFLLLFLFYQMFV